MRNKFLKKFSAMVLSVAMIVSNTHIETKASAINFLKPHELNPAFVDYIKNKDSKKQDDIFNLSSGSSLLLSSSALKTSRMTGLVPAPFELKSEYEPVLRGTDSTLPAAYTATAQGLGLNVRDQGRFGSCWAFGTTAALEDFIKLKGLGLDPDYSEMNMVYNLNKYASRKNPYEFDYEEGGYNGMVAAYLSSGRGTVLEEYDRYDDENAFDKSDESLWTVKSRSYQETKSKPKDKFVRDIILLPDVEDVSDPIQVEAHRNLVKKLVKDYGSVGTSFYWDHDFATPDLKNYYLPIITDEADEANHLVNIVGWDDNYPKENFTIEVKDKDGNVTETFIPEHDGAFIIKNSWGKDIHDNGYFYMSYEDAYAGFNIFAVTDVDETKEKYNFDNIYQYDYFGMCSTLDVDSNELYQCRIFDLKTPYEKLTDIGLFTASNNTECEFYLAELDNSGRPIGIGEKLGEKLYEFAGYHTYLLDKEVVLDQSENSSTCRNGKFGIVIKMSGENLSLPVEVMLEGYSSKAIGKPEKNYVSIDNKDWVDLYYYEEIQEDDYYFTNLNIKAFTEKAEKPNPPTPEPTPEPSPTPVTPNIPSGGGGSTTGGGSFNTLDTGSNSIVSNIVEDTKKIPDYTSLKTNYKISRDMISKARTVPYISGNGDGNFDPSGKISYAHVQKILSNIFSSEVSKFDFQKNLDKNIKLDDKLTRADAINILYDVVKLLSDSGMDYTVVDRKQKFNDVESEYLQNKLDYLVNRDIINGYENNNFCPDNYLTRAEFIKIMSKVLRRSSSWNGKISFKDVPSNFWAYGYIMNAANGE